CHTPKHIVTSIASLFGELAQFYQCEILRLSEINEEKRLIIKGEWYHGARSREKPEGKMAGKIIKNPVHYYFR
ncbi:MAG: hypothetical protein ABFC57_01815, partial [Veillonellales bacterium]